MRQMVSADEDGHLYYESANEAADIADYLEKKPFTLRQQSPMARLLTPFRSHLSTKKIACPSKVSGLLL